MTITLKAFLWTLCFGLLASSATLAAESVPTSQTGKAVQTVASDATNDGATLQDIQGTVVDLRDKLDFNLSSSFSCKTNSDCPKNTTCCHNRDGSSFCGSACDGR